MARVTAGVPGAPWSRRTCGRAVLHAIALPDGCEHGTAPQPPRLLKFHAPEIVFGIDSMAEAAHAALRLGAVRPMLVTDPGLIEAGWAAEMLGHLKAQGLDARVWNDLTPNPKDHEITAGHQVYAEHGCDVLVAVGGGSVIDAAKGVAILAANGGNILDYEGVDKAHLPIPPLVVVLPPLPIIGVVAGVLALVLGSVAFLASRTYGRATLGERRARRASRQGAAVWSTPTEHGDG